MDGSAPGVIAYENFNAASAIVDITGVSVHPGEAKGIMENALLIAQEFNALLPPDAVPARTQGYQGFFHLDALNGTAASARMEYIIRDHDKGEFTVKQGLMKMAAAQALANLIAPEELSADYIIPKAFDKRVGPAVAKAVAEAARASGVARL